MPPLTFLGPVNTGDIYEAKDGFKKTGFSDTSFLLAGGGTTLVSNFAIAANYYTKTQLQTSGQALVNWGNLTGVPATFPAAAHNHDDRYYTEIESDGRFVKRSEISFNVYAVSSGTNITNSTGVKIRLPLTTSSSNMIMFTVRVYQNYNTFDIIFSGYLYASVNNWYIPMAELSAGSSSIQVKMGRDTDGKAYVWLMGGNHSSVSVINVNNRSGYDANSGWEIIHNTNDTPNVVLDQIIYPNIKTNHVVNTITPTNISNWNTAFGWGTHVGLYSLLGHTHTKAQVGLSNVDNTADAIKNVATAGSLRNVNITLIQLNSMTLEPGIYNAEGFAPAQGLTGLYHYIIQLGSYTGGGFRAQIAIPYQNGTNDSMYIRLAVGNNWGNWERIAKNSDITAAINALNLGGTYAPVSHGHAISDVTGLQNALNGKVDDSQVLTNVPVGAVFTDTIYNHPTTAGNKHIPAGGVAGQILRWSADGTAVWGVDNNTTYSVFTTNTAGLVPGRVGSTTTKYLREDGTWTVPPNDNTTYPIFTGTATPGLVPARVGTTSTTKYLREDGRWEVPPDNNTVYTNGTGLALASNQFSLTTAVTTDIAKGVTAHGWGNHAAQGYLTGFTETDPTVPTWVKSITQANIAEWQGKVNRHGDTMSGGLNINPGTLQHTHEFKTDHAGGRNDLYVRSDNANVVYRVSVQDDGIYTWALGPSTSMGNGTGFDYFQMPAWNSQFRVGFFATQFPSYMLAISGSGYFGGDVYSEGISIASEGFVHDQYNDPDALLTSDGGATYTGLDIIINGGQLRINPIEITSSGTPIDCSTLKHKLFYIRVRNGNKISLSNPQPGQRFILFNVDGNGSEVEINSNLVGKLDSYTKVSLYITNIGEHLFYDKGELYIGGF